jgi:transglutaminase-like putative cysteine protease
VRFAVAHKTSSYLMVGSAYLALLAGGAVSAAVSAAGVLGLVASWWWEPPRVRIDRWTLLWTIASIAVLALVTAAAVATGDWFGGAASFLVWLVVAKAFNRRSSKDWQQLYILSFLMLVAGSVLNNDVTYGVAFLGFVIAATWALTLSHLRREMEDNFLLKHADDRSSERVEVRRILESRRIVGGRFFVGTGLVSLGVFALATLMFLSIPRVGAGFFMKQRDGLNFVGFRDGVKLGGHGTLKSDDTVVMRVEIAAPYRGREAPWVHWRGTAYDEYSGGEWRRSRRAIVTDSIVDDVGRARRRTLVYDGSGYHTDYLDGAVEQTIWLEPLGVDVLFGAAMPRQFEHGQPRREPRRPDRNDEVRLEHGSGIRYKVWSAIEPPDPDRLRAAPDRLPRGYDVYLQWPEDEITEATRALAAELTAGLTSDYDRAVAIRDYLRDRLEYTLELRDPGGKEPIDFFLFDYRKGHCEYFASAFTILARLAGVPARQVNGFLGGEWNEYDDYIAVRAGDAHSWSEVYFHGVGWVTFDATPASQDRLGRGGDGVRDKLRRFLDRLRFQWTKWVIEYDLSRQLGLFDDVGDGLRDAGGWLEARWDDLRGWARRNAALAIGLAAAALGLLGWRLWRRRRRRAAGRAAEPRPRPRSPVAAEYTRVLARLEKRGVARPPGMTPRELAREVAARELPFAASLGELTELYYAAQWGGDPDPSLVSRARELGAAIEAALAKLPR